jgi:hypothetical protein
MFLCVSTLMSRAEMRDVPPPDPLESQALLLADRAADVPPEAQNVPGRRVRPPVPGQGRLINVQIDPEEQARFLAALPIFPQDQPRPAIAVDPSVSADPDAETAFPWFWASVSPSIHDASPGRLELATSGLLDMGTGAAVPTPRLQSMQAIAEEHGADILRATIGTRVSPALVLAVIGIESAGRIDAVSHKGATGLMQLMPATAERFGVSDITDPAENIKGGVAYLDWLMEEFMGDPMMVLAAYNAGEGAVVEHGGVPPYRETRDYVPKVLAAWTVARGLCVTPPELLTDGCVFTVHTAGL